MSAHVYRAYDKADRLLYVGCTVDLTARLSQHADNSDWFIFADRITTEEFESRDEAEAAESRAILAEHPRWNIRGRSPDHPDGHASTGKPARWLKGEKEVARSLRQIERERARLITKLEHLDRDHAAVMALVDQISRGSVEYGRDYDLEGPIPTRERKRRALIDMATEVAS